MHQCALYNPKYGSLVLVLVFVICFCFVLFCFVLFFVFCFFYFVVCLVFFLCLTKIDVYIVTDRYTTLVPYLWRVRVSFSMKRRHLFIWILSWFAKLKFSSYCKRENGKKYNIILSKEITVNRRTWYPTPSLSWCNSWCGRLDCGKSWTRFLVG